MHISEYMNCVLTRCLEEGAEAFFLKPLKLSDLETLEPHLLKSKDVNEKHNPFKSNTVGVLSKRNKRKRAEEHDKFLHETEVIAKRN
jgi:hypothetical protein